MCTDVTDGPRVKIRCVGAVEKKIELLLLQTVTGQA